MALFAWQGRVYGYPTWDRLEREHRAVMHPERPCAEDCYTVNVDPAEGRDHTNTTTSAYIDCVPCTIKLGKQIQMEVLPRQLEEDRTFFGCPVCGHMVAVGVVTP